MNVIFSSGRRTRLMDRGVVLDGMELGWWSVAVSLERGICSAGWLGTLS